MSEERYDESREWTRGGTDARDGASHPRTAAAPAAAPKLDKRTFLVAHSPSHSSTLHPIGSTWTIKIHDFGKQWVEGSWGKSDPQPGKKGCKGRSPDRARNEQRARARATGEIRRKCISIAADHLVTLTYRDNVANRDRVLRDLDRLRRMLTRAGYPCPSWPCWSVNSVGRFIHTSRCADFRMCASCGAAGTRSWVMETDKST